MAIAEPDLTRNGALQPRTAVLKAVSVSSVNRLPSTATARGPEQGAATGGTAYFEVIQQDAERLLKYAAETGRSVDADIRNSILSARAVPIAQWSPETSSELLDALTRLTAQLHPVTGESLRACAEEHHTVRGYWKIAALLAVVIVPFSVASFVSSALSDEIRKEITSANELAVKLTAQLQLGTEPDQASAVTSGAAALRADVPVVEIVTEMQQFAAAIRSIDGRTRQLKTLLTIFAPEDPFAAVRKNVNQLHDVFELPSSLLSDTRNVAMRRIQVYQKVRYFAQSSVEDVSLFYGALTTCVLPLLYALLGTCAYLLRSFEDQMRTRTFIPSSANSARFLIAGIGGAVVGLFNNFNITQGASIPPLAIAFLVGYAVDVFFSFLEGLLQTFSKPKAAQTVPAGSGGAAVQV